jgi:hypothetical protein
MTSEMRETSILQPRLAPIRRHDKINENAIN